MLKIGVNTFLLTSPFTSEQVDIFGQFKAWGCDAVEIALEDASHIDPRIIKQALSEHNITCSSICAAMGPGRDLRGTPAEQQAAIEYITQVMEVMAQIECPVMVGPLYSTVGRAEPTPKDEYRKQWDTVVSHLQRLAARAGDLGVKLALEPLNRYETDFINTADQVTALVDDIGHQAIGILLDTYHMNIEEKDSAAAIRKAGHRLLHVHACGCDRGAPGGDHIDWDRIRGALQEVNYRGNLVIESFTPAVKVIAKAASIWRDFEPSREDIAKKGVAFLRNHFMTGF
ncbi:sugar phosphate isomerase/epimerase family protein [Parapedobacter sp. 10938]|uniref:sugar phosphate isomerase/epimerase family protein n=1 Tax=Parapedobacter flavus TaxID=3110225 RepID=UPI002DB742F4|nr:sugar phosphate isomerase/epimerase family protein [Parapedobacter sp. 10938]MEC3879031.1 sugar phosphate isomerase/epimerase family protein [Parapedobacter sp. 10938]